MGCGSSSTATETRQETEQKSQPPPKPKPAGGADVGAGKQNDAASKSQPPETKTKEEPTPKGGGGGGSGSGSDGSPFIDEGVKRHNELRKLHGAPPLTHAQDLTDFSQNWANNIAARDTMEHSKCTLPSGGRVGENIYCFWSSAPSEPNASDAVQSWYDEIKDYDFNDHGFAMNTGHFTQVVWKGTQEVGIAHARAKSGTIYIVANYRPAGNMMGDFEKNVAPPS